MPYKKGHEKLGGRKKGTPNKTPKPVKELLSSFTLESWERFLFEMETLSGIEYVKSYLQLLDYQIPKLQRIEVPIEKEDQPKEIVFRFQDSVEVTDPVFTFSELPLKKQEEILKKAKVKVRPREDSRSKRTPPPKPSEEREHWRPTPENTYTPPSPPPKPEKRHEQMETLRNVSKFSNNDFIIR